MGGTVLDRVLRGGPSEEVARTRETLGEEQRQLMGGMAWHRARGEMQSAKCKKEKHALLTLYTRRYHKVRKRSGHMLNS